MINRAAPSPKPMWIICKTPRGSPQYPRMLEPSSRTQATWVRTEIDRAP